MKNARSLKFQLKWSGRRDSNSQQSAWKAGTLANWVTPAYYLVGLLGLEPRTDRLWAGCSNQLSYEPLRLAAFYLCYPSFVSDALAVGVFICTLEDEVLGHLRRFLATQATLCASAMEMMGFEPMTPCLQGRCSPNWATPPFGFFLWLGLLCFVNELLTLTQNWTTTYSCYFSSYQKDSCSILLQFSLERRWSSRTFRYGYLVTT